MKTSFTLRDFPISTSDTFDQKQALLVIRDVSEIPEPFQNPFLEAALKASKLSDGKFLTVEGQYQGMEKLGILRIDPNKPLSHQVAEATRSFEGSMGIYVGNSLDCNAAIFGFALGAYRFSNYLTKEKEPLSYELVQSPHLVSHELLTRIQSIYLARDLVNMPSNEKNPQKLTLLVRNLPWKSTVVRAMDADELREKGFGMLLAVSSGSAVPASVLVFERNIAPMASPDSGAVDKQSPGSSSQDPLPKPFPDYGIIGKGVTFDAGGLQIKPDKAMADMKMDMAGAAATIAAFWYLDQCDVAKSVVGAVGLVENLLGGSAFKPLDIVRAHNGLTVEIHHTDAEGRLVLGDLASYVSQTYLPSK
jgi:leucyl aminopeptidase